MSKIYSDVDERREQRRLLLITCDAAGCGASIKPHRAIVLSGWTTRGLREDERVYEWHYCPEHR